ncbi:mandelate racemase/muconate lactonizing enzyme family protein [Streptomyces sp. NPDC048479]|uniref:mandelate racemase/muconate lactonizing enzyme family protein n=1 Tax=Streptomyces sp. NPDC048479 TaxID=3154725 RepID=UPI00342EE169
MKITAIRLERMRLPLEPAFAAAWDPAPRTFFDATLVTVETDEGVVGHGSGDTMDGFEAFEYLFLGKDPLEILSHVRIIETINFHAGRYWPLEAALWDIVGKVCGCPVATLFGGAATRLPAYASFGELKEPAARAEAAVAAVERGFKAMKIRISRDRLEEGVAAVRAAREAVGDGIDIMVDLNQMWRMSGDIEPALDLVSVRRIAARLMELGVLWLEEPLPQTDIRGARSVRAATGVRIAGGEMVRSLPELVQLVEEDAFDVYQPDVVLAVGMYRARFVAELAQLRHRWFTPHTWSNGLGLLANLHVVAGVGGGPYVEFPYDPPGWTPERRDFFLTEPVEIDSEGFLNIPDAPGLGAAIDHDALSQLRHDR